MRLIGMLDSPYVRRVAVSMKLMGVTFTHESISVFSTFDAFAAINPVVKAPTLVTDDGVVLMESSLILEHVERLVDPGRRLSPVEPAQHAHTQRIIGLALAACEKNVQILYELNLRPKDKQHQPWLDRVRLQMDTAYRLLEVEISKRDPLLSEHRPLQAEITSAVAFRFARETLPDAIDSTALPALAALSARAEALDAFRAFQYP